MQHLCVWLLWGFASYVSFLVNLFRNFSPFSYGLAGAVISGDRERCQRLAEVWLSEGLKHYFIGVAWSLHPCSKLSFFHLCSLHNIDSFLYYSSQVCFIQLLRLFCCVFVTTVWCQFQLQEINAGCIWVNCSQPCFCQAPWGGNKRSGFGRELGEGWAEHGDHVLKA
jgi:hypothetical protein